MSQESPHPQTPWTAPVVAPTPPRYFLVAEREWAWEEVKDDPQSEAFAEKFGDGRTAVDLYELGPMSFRLVCSSYYSDFGVCELVISQPLERAMAIFNALLIADGESESGTLQGVSVS